MTERENQYPELANVKADEIGVWSEIKIGEGLSVGEIAIVENVSEHMIEEGGK